MWVLGCRKNDFSLWLSFFIKKSSLPVRRQHTHTHTHIHIYASVCMYKYMYIHNGNVKNNCPTYKMFQNEHSRATLGCTQAIAYFTWGRVGAEVTHARHWKHKAFQWHRDRRRFHTRCFQHGDNILRQVASSGLKLGWAFDHFDLAWPRGGTGNGREFAWLTGIEVVIFKIQGILAPSRRQGLGMGCQRFRESTGGTMADEGSLQGSRSATGYGGRCHPRQGHQQVGRCHFQEEIATNGNWNIWSISNPIE